MAGAIGFGVISKLSSSERLELAIVAHLQLLAEIAEPYEEGRPALREVQSPLLGSLPGGRESSQRLRGHLRQC